MYAKIIQDVIRDSKTEFEENGVSQTTLGELEKVSRIPSFGHACHDTNVMTRSTSYPLAWRSVPFSSSYPLCTQTEKDHLFRLPVSLYSEKASDGGDTS